MPALEIKPLLRCLECDRQFTLLDVREGMYAGATGICLGCYIKMQKDGARCFGKKSDGRILGYDPKAIECSAFCPDREICKEFAISGIPEKLDS